MERLVRDRFPRYARVCVVAGVSLCPLTFYLHTANGFGVPSMTLLWLTAVLATALCAASALSGGVRLPRSTIIVAVVVFLAASALATVFSLSPKLSTCGRFLRYGGGLISRAAFVSIMVAVVALFWDDPRRLRALVLAISASSFVLAGSVLLQEAGVDRTLWPGPVPGSKYDYPYGTIGHSNFAGAQLGITVVCLWCLRRTARSRWWAGAASAAMAINLAALWFTQSRSGMVAAGVGLLTAAFVSRDRLRASVRRGLVVCAALAVIAGAAVAWHPGSTRVSREILGVHTLRTKTLLLRLQYWRAAGRIFLDHPVVGTGLDTFYAYYPRYREADDAPGLDRVASSGVAPIVFSEDKPHNILLEHALSSGALGLGSYLAVVGLGLFYGRRRCRSLAGEDRFLLSAFVGVLAAYLAQGLFLIDEPNLALLGWVAIGGIAAFADPATVAARSDPRPSRAKPCGVTARVASYTMLLAVVAVLAHAALRPLRADVAFAQGDFHEALALNPVNGEFLLKSGIAVEQAALASETLPDRSRLLEEARELFLRGLKLQPRDTNFLVQLAQVETFWAVYLDPSHFIQAEQWWRRTLEEDPKSHGFRVRYDEQFRQAKETTIARLEADSRVRPDDVGAQLTLAKGYLGVGNSSASRAALQYVLRLAPAHPEAEKLLASLPG